MSTPTSSSRSGRPLLHFLAERANDNAPVVLDVATVLDVVPGEASDGSALLVVRWRGADVAVPYLATYTPTEGDVVALLVPTGGRQLCLGRVTGTP